MHGTWLVAIVSGGASPTDRFLAELMDVFADGPVVIGPTAPTLAAAHRSATEAIAGMNAVAGWARRAAAGVGPRITPRAGATGRHHRPLAALEAEVMRPLADAGPALTETLDAYLDSGGAIEACARKLFVHPNTVRYRLKRIADFTGRDPTLPRDSYVLRVATTVGSLTRQAQHSTSAVGGCRTGHRCQTSHSWGPNRP